MPSELVKPLNSKAEFDAFLKEHKKVMVDFWATWVGQAAQAVRRGLPRGPVLTPSLPLPFPSPSLFSAGAGRAR